MSNPKAIPLVTVQSKMYAPDSDMQIHRFMSGECLLASTLNLDVPHRRGYEKDLLLDGVTNARLGEFKNEVCNMSVCGLYGCVAIAVVSEKGAWLAHCWEHPAMSNMTKLDRDVLQVPKLSSFTGPGEMFHADSNSRILILSPGIPSEGSSSDSSSSMLVYNLDDEGMRYKNQVRNINNVLRGIIPTAVETKYVSYDVYKSTIANEITAKGKLLVQYTPAQTISPNGKQKAMIRVYAVDYADRQMEISFDAHPDQKL